MTKAICGKEPLITSPWSNKEIRESDQNINQLILTSNIYNLQLTTFTAAISSLNTLTMSVASVLFKDRIV